MPNRCWIRLVFVCFLVLMLAGCGSFKKDTGSIKGQVLNQQGTGVAGVMVAIEKLGITAQTDQSGWYRLDKVPEGVHTVSVLAGGKGGASSPSKASSKAAAKTSARAAAVDLSAYRVQIADDGLVSLMRDGQRVSYQELRQIAVASGATAQGSIQVTVKRGMTVTANPIILLPSNTQLNNIVVYQADPAPATEALQANTKQSVSYDIAYTLQATNAKLAVFFSMYQSDQAFTYLQVDIANSGSGERVLSGEIEVPDTLSVAADAVLFDQKGVVLAIALIDEYAVSGGTKPRAPYLSIDRAGFAGVDLSWRGGNTTGFKRYEIWRDNSVIATFNDPNVTSYTDLFPREDATNRYTIYMYDNASSSYSSNNVDVYVSSVGRKSVNISGTPVSAVLDPARDFGYVAFEDNNYISKINMEGNEVAKLGVCAHPRQLAVAGKGALMAVMCPWSATMVLVDLNTYQTSKVIRGLNNAHGVAIDPAGQRVYVGTDAGLLYVDTATGEVIKPDGFDYLNIGEVALDSTGETLYFYAAGKVIALRTTDFTQKQSFDTSWNRWIVPDTKSKKLYLGPAAYDMDSGTLLQGDLGFTVRSISDDQDMLFGIHGDDFWLLKRNANAWIKVDQAPSDYWFSSISVNADSSQALVAYGERGDYGLYLLDLVTRLQVRQGGK